MVRRSVGTTDTVREGILLNCLLYEFEGLPSLRNVQGNNFRDQISKAIIEAGGLDPSSGYKRRNEPPTLSRTVQQVVRARIAAMPLDQVRSWLLDGRDLTIDSVFSRAYNSIAAERSGTKPAL